MRWLYAVVPILIVLSLIAWRWEAKSVATAAQAQMMKRRMSAPASVELGAVQFRDLVTSFEATGSVESPQNIKISPKVTGLILTPKANDRKYHVLNEGDFVREGQVLARIDPSEYRANVDQAKAAFAQAKFHLVQAQLTKNPNDTMVSTAIRQQQAGVDSAKTNFNQATRNFTAQQNAAEAAVRDATSKVTSADVAVENAQAGINSAEASYNSALTGVTNAQTAIASAEANRDSAKTAIENAKASIKSAQANLADAKAKLERTTTLYEEKYETKQDVDDAQAAESVQSAAVEVAQGQLKQANSALAAQDAAVDTAKGQLEMAKSSLKVQEAAVSVAKGQKRAAEAALTSAKEEKSSADEQLNIVVTSGKASIQDTDNALTQAKESLTYARSNLAQQPAYVQNLYALKAAVEASQAQLELAKTQLAETELTAPFDGYITTLSLEPGSMATPGQPIFSMQSINAVWVSIAVPEYVFTKVRDGQPASVQFDSFPGQTFTARIVQLNPAADPQGRQFTLRAVLANANKQFKPGMFARVSVETERVSHALVAPREAVLQDAGGSYVMTVDAQNIAHRCPVTTGASDVAFLQVDGVQPGEKVVVMSASPLKEGKAVTSGGGRRGQHGGVGNQAGAPGNAGSTSTTPSTPASAGSGSRKHRQSGASSPDAGTSTHDGTASSMPNPPGSAQPAHGG